MLRPRSPVLDLALGALEAFDPRRSVLSGRLFLLAGLDEVLDLLAPLAQQILELSHRLGTLHRGGGILLLPDAADAAAGAGFQALDVSAVEVAELQAARYALDGRREVANELVQLLVEFRLLLFVGASPLVGLGKQGSVRRRK